MSITGITGVSSGSVMDWGTDIKANMDAVRVWFNGGVVLGDFAAAGLARENIYRPDIYGFPRNGLIGQSQQLLSDSKRLDEAHAAENWTGTTINAREWKARRDRTTVKVHDVPQGGVYAFDIGKRFRLGSQSMVGVRCQVDSLFTDITAGAGYPDGAGAGYKAGYLVLVTYSLDQDLETERNESIQHVYPPHGSRQFIPDQHELEFSAPLGAGEWDVYLAYKRGGLPDHAASPTAYQLDIGRVNFKVEILDNKTLV